jgi:carbonic anhydrase/acetyltransferase-like protein (isoleucine patch superfamily)
VIGDSVSILQGVTLGGTGKATGDRHPKVESHVLIGAHSTVLGNIKIERGSMISAGSLVLKPVKARTMVAGSPAKVVGQVRASEPELVMDHHIAPSASTFVDDSNEVARSRALDEEGEWKKKIGEADDADIERVRSQVMSADEKRRRRRDRG